MAEWFYRKSGLAGENTEGPLSSEAIFGLCREGRIGRDTLVSSRQQTALAWVPASTQPSLLCEIEEGEAERRLNAHLVRDYQKDRVIGAIFRAGQFIRQHWNVFGIALLVCILAFLGTVTVVGVHRWITYLQTESANTVKEFARQSIQTHESNTTDRQRATTANQTLGQMWLDTFSTYQNPKLMQYLKGDATFSSLPEISSKRDLRDGYGSRGSRVRHKWSNAPSIFIGELTDGTEVAVFLAEGQTASGGTIDLTNQLVVVHFTPDCLYKNGTRKAIMTVSVIAPRYADAASEVARSRK